MGTLGSEISQHGEPVLSTDYSLHEPPTDNQTYYSYTTLMYYLIPDGIDLEQYVDNLVDVEGVISPKESQVPSWMINKHWIEVTKITIVSPGEN